MSKEEKRSVSRRSFVRQASQLAGAVALGQSAAAGGAEADAAGGPGPLPRRVLGRTGLPVTCLSLGTAPAGIAKTIDSQAVARVVEEAIDLGVNFVDTSPKYGNAEEGVGLVMARRRQEVVLATKVWADTIEDAERSLARSLKTLHTEYVDVLYYHHLGDRDVERARQADGVFTWLLKQKEAGRCRFVGISGHNLPGRFPEFLQTGQVDAILVLVNFVDRHTYAFEEKVLPVAREHNTGIVAMKVFGGPDPQTGSWGNPDAKPMVGTDRVELAIRYALSVPGVAAVNLGVHTVDQVRQNVELVKRFTPLSTEEWESVGRLGRQLAAQWGDHFGPVS